MKKALFILIFVAAFCLPLAAQVPSTYLRPTATTILNGDLAAGDTTIFVYDPSSFPSSGYLQIGTEVISYSSKNNEAFLGCVRGYANTTAAAYISGSVVVRLLSISDASSANYVAQVNNVRLDGACAGDGVTDDTACIQAQIDIAEASTTRKIVYLPEGQYLISSSLTVPTGVTMLGSGPNSVIMTSGTLAGAMITVDASATDTRLEGFKLAPTSAQQGIVISAGSTRIVLRNLIITNITADASAGSPASTSGVYVANTSTNLTIEHCTFSNNGILNSTDGADIYFAAGATPHAGAIINGTRISGGQGKFSIALFDASGSRITRNNIDQNNKTNGGNNDGYGIVVYGATAVISYNEVSGNYITNTAGSGIYLVDSYYSSVTSNQLFDTVKQQGDVTLPAGAISLNGADWSTVTGNTIKTSGQGGIAINGRAAVSTAHGITVSNNTIDGAAGEGAIRFKNNCHECTVSDITVKSSVRGVYSPSPIAHDGLKLSNITIYDPSSNGVYLDSCSHCGLINIKVYSAGAQAIIVLGGTRNSLIGLTIKDGSSTGLDYRGTRSVITNAEITGNSTGIDDSGSNNLYYANKVQNNTTEASIASTTQQLTITTSATPSVAEADFFVLTYGSPTTLTNLTGGNVLSPIKTFMATNGNVTFSASGFFVLQGNKDLTLNADESISFYYKGGYWYEIGSNARSRTFVQSRFLIGTDTYGREIEVNKSASVVGATIHNTSATGVGGFRALNDTPTTFGHEITGSSYASGYLTGGPSSGAAAYTYTDGNVPWVLGTNNTARLKVDGSGIVTWAFGTGASTFNWTGNTSSNPALELTHSNTSATGPVLQISTSVSTLEHPLIIKPRGGQSVDVDHLQNVVLGKGAIGSTATDGFVYFPVIGSGAEPSGTPTTYTGWGALNLESDSINGEYRLWGYLNGAWRNLSAGTAGAPSLTATYIGFGDGSNLLTGGANLTWTNASQTLTIANSSGTGFIDLKGASNSGALRLQGGTHPGSGGGIIFPFVGGSQSSGPGIWWSNGTYGSTAGIWLSSGLNFQGYNSSNSSLKLRTGTGTSSDGSVRFQFDPDNNLATQTVSVGNTNTTFDGQLFDVSSTGTAAANFGFGRLVKLENGSGSQVDAGRLAVRWATATAGSETTKTTIQNNLSSGGLADSFTIEGDSHYGVASSQSASGSVTINFLTGNTQSLTMTGNVTTLTLSNHRDGGIYILHFIQDGTGSRVLTVPSTLKVEGGSYVVTATASARDTLICSSNGTNLYCVKGADVK